MLRKTHLRKNLKPNNNHSSTKFVRCSLNGKFNREKLKLTNRSNRKHKKSKVSYLKYFDKFLDTLFQEKHEKAPKLLQVARGTSLQMTQRLRKSKMMI